MTEVEKNAESATAGQSEELELTDSQKTVVVKKQTSKEFWLLLKIIQKGGKDAYSRLQDAESESQHVMVFLDVGMEYAEKELREFLAGMAGMTVPEYDEADFDVTLTILEKWQEQEDLAGFFRRASNFVKKFLAKK